MTDRPSWEDLNQNRQRAGEAEPDEIEEICARLFSSGDGRRFLKLLRDRKMDRMLPATAPESSLRDLEGQRRLVLEIEMWARRGFDRLARANKSDQTS